MTIAATQIYSFVATIPGGGDTQTFTVINCQFPAASVVAIRWRVPPGPSGYMGFQITSDGVPVIPVQQGAFIVADDEMAQWDISGYPDAGNWQVTGYNADTYPHSVYVDFLTVEPGADVPAPAVSAASSPTVDNAAISPAPVTAADLIAGLTVQS